MTDTDKAGKDSPSPEKAAGKAGEDKGKPGNKAVWMGTAVGIGSAALVAALLYAKRRP